MTRHPHTTQLLRTIIIVTATVLPLSAAADLLLLLLLVTKQCCPAAAPPLVLSPLQRNVCCDGPPARCSQPHQPCQLIIAAPQRVTLGDAASLRVQLCCGIRLQGWQR
jgi:hypothetical protein